MLIPNIFRGLSVSLVNSWGLWQDISEWKDWSKHMTDRTGQEQHTDRPCDEKNTFLKRILGNFMQKQLQFIILNPPEWTEKKGFPKERCILLQKDAFSYRKMRFPAEKMPFPSEKCGFQVAHGRKPQEGFRAQESRTLANFHKRISRA